MPHQNTTSSKATAQNAATDPQAPNDRAVEQNDAVRPEAPAVVRAFDRLALAGLVHQPARRQRGGAVGADVSHGIDLTRAGAADQHRLAHDLMALKAGRRDIPGQGYEIPGVGHEALAERRGADL